MGCTALPYPLRQAVEYWDLLPAATHTRCSFHVICTAAMEASLHCACLRQGLLQSSFITRKALAYHACASRILWTAFTLLWAWPGRSRPISGCMQAWCWPCKLLVTLGSTLGKEMGRLLLYHCLSAHDWAAGQSRSCILEQKPLMSSGSSVSCADCTHSREN